MESGAGSRVEPRAEDIDRVERAIGWRPTRFVPAAINRGTSDTAARWIVADDRDPEAGGRRAFVKIGATELTAEWTRLEHQNYRALRGEFLAKVLGFDDDGLRPVLALEDLSGCYWPPPWTDERVTAVVEALKAVRQTPPPGHLAPKQPDNGVDWRSVKSDPMPFIALGLCSRSWIESHVGRLIDASAGAPIAGHSLVHLDIRSDNVCFRDGRAIVIDWNHATIANSDLDVAFWLPSLHAEGGPPPEAILPDEPGLAAWVAGFFCARAGGVPLPEAPHVRALQRQQAQTALPWAARALGLPPP